MRRHRAAEGGGPYPSSVGAGPLAGPFPGNPDAHNQKDRPSGRSFFYGYGLTTVTVVPLVPMNMISSSVTRRWYSRGLSA